MPGGRVTDISLATLSIDRERIVRLCIGITGDPDAAEDLAQETLFEAWRHEHALRDPSRRARWLSGIARNVCLRWARRRGRELSRLAHPRPGDEDGVSLIEALPDEDYDIALELERDELARLLDRALALLPPETRAVLVGRLVEELPGREVAARLGITEASVAVRLQRGKLCLRRVLVSRFPSEAAAHGLLPSPEQRWEDTPLWCPQCGRTRLQAYWLEPYRRFHHRCPACDGEGGYSLSYSSNGFGRLRSLPAVIRECVGAGDRLRRIFSSSAYPRCEHCGAPVPLRHREEMLAVDWECGACGNGLFGTSVEVFAVSLPQGQHLWREHKKVRTTRGAVVETAGRSAVPVTIQSMNSAARLDAVFALDTYEVLRLGGSAARE